jgi:glycosyltransferase involved in cell wall biosynthesis
MDVIGQDPPEKLLDLARRDPSYRVHGFVDDVRNYIEEAGIYVCPIREGGGTRLKILDALAMRKPLVAHPLSCEGIDVKDGESVLFATHPAEFRDNILLLLGNKELRNKMGEAGRDLVCKKYSYASIGNKLSQLYLEVQKSSR